jgi:uncharacterized protein YndB with AHSA1/START domain
MPHRLDRSILINASRETVFGYFTDSTRWARWWGQGSAIDARAGGAVQIVHPGGVQVAGEILEIDPPARLVFTYGYVSGAPMPVGASVVTIQLEDDRQGTRLNLSHVFADENVRNEMAQGWRFQLSLFGNLGRQRRSRGRGTAIDGWFAAWSEPDTAKREALLDRLATEDVRFRDRFSLIDGLSDLRPHLAAVHKFMPACASSARATPGTARARCWPTGSRRATDGSEARPRHQRVRPRPPRPHRVGDRFLEPAESDVGPPAPTTDNYTFTPSAAVPAR